MEQKTYKRNSLERKYDAITRLIGSLRLYNDNAAPIPQFRQIGREMGMTHQNLQFIWGNRDSIVDRAKRKLPLSLLEQHYEVNSLRSHFQIQRILDTLAERDLEKESFAELIKLIRTLFEMQHVQREYEKHWQSVREYSHPSTPS